MRSIRPYLLLSALLGACVLPAPIVTAPSTLGTSAARPTPPNPRVPDAIDPIVCASTGEELLPTLAGSWTLEQGDGLVWAWTDDGAIILPLPSPAPTRLTFEYQANGGQIRARGDDPDDEMTLFAATSDQVAASAPLIDAGDMTSGTGCDWLDSPLMIGTNRYLGYEVLPQGRNATWLPTCNMLLLVRTGVTEQCEDEPVPTADDFEMEVTLLVRFSGPGHATGMVYFEGASGSTDDLGDRDRESEFRGRAPVELMR